jgi:hypothetical protein
MFSNEDHENEIKELEARLKKLESKGKDIWDKLNIIGSLPTFRRLTGNKRCGVF